MFGLVAPIFLRFNLLDNHWHVNYIFFKICSIYLRHVDLLRLVVLPLLNALVPLRCQHQNHGLLFFESILEKTFLPQTMEA